MRADGCDVWTSTQIQTSAHGTAVKITGLPPRALESTRYFLAADLGARGDDFVGEAVEISKAVGAPMKLTWSREDDIQHDL